MVKFGIVGKNIANRTKSVTKPIPKNELERNYGCLKLRMSQNSWQ